MTNQRAAAMANREKDKQPVAIVTTPKSGLLADAERKCINWNKSSDRKWLMNHLHHCMLNEKIVSLTPIKRII